MPRLFTKLSILVLLTCGGILPPSQSYEAQNSNKPSDNPAALVPTFGAKGLLPLNYYEKWLHIHGKKPLKEGEKLMIEKAKLPSQGNTKEGVYDAIDPEQAIVNRSIDAFKQLENILLKHDANFKAIAVIGAGWKMGAVVRASVPWFQLKDKKYLVARRELYYLVDIEKNVDPDLVANVMVENQINLLGHDNFDLIMLENLDCTAMLSKNLWLAAYAALKKGGQIKSKMVSSCRRLVPILLNTIGISYKFKFDDEDRKSASDYAKEIEDIETGKFKGKFGGINGIELNTEENKQKAINQLKAEIAKWELDYITITK